MPLRVCIFDPAWSTFGGGEKYLLAMAEVISRAPEYSVQLLTVDPAHTRERFATYFGLDLSNVALVCEPQVTEHLAKTDIGIIASNFRSYGLHAKKNVYVLHTPYSSLSPRAFIAKAIHGSVKQVAKDFLRKRLFRDAQHADLTLVNSGFAQEALKRLHNVSAQVLYPSIDDFVLDGPKSPIIVSVGRFFRGLYNDKRQDVLIDAFKRLFDRHAQASLEYHLLGSCSNDAASQSYLDTLRQRALGYPVFLHPNAPYADVGRFYQKASIFWHAAGYEVDEEVHPERVEHFGMTTVEAMSARCVPVVINKGGQKEIVSHGISGYLWGNTDELVERTAVLLKNPDQLTHMGEEARQRAGDFDKEHFTRQVFFYLDQLNRKSDDKTESNT
jgi:glycosyltransferase involved in cell wall biosynthesis